ncbi:MAG: hypothetical protein IT371_10065 [Deltaproteobacteria bacterium]|nr:hypothetical protein [Deltaproteobacteria bacterium]
MTVVPWDGRREPFRASKGVRWRSKGWLWRCRAGTCLIQCAPGFANCNGKRTGAGKKLDELPGFEQNDDDEDGCEAELARDVHNCRGCGVTCSAAAECAPEAGVGRCRCKHPYRAAEPPAAQSILALAALAQRPGEALSMADVATGIWKLGGLNRKPTSPDQKDLKYKLTNPFTKALPNGEAKNLVQAVRGSGLRLNLRPEAVQIVLRDGVVRGADSNLSKG